MVNDWTPPPLPETARVLGGQALHFDAMGQAWEWNPTTGEVLVSPRDGCGDGAYVWQSDGAGRLARVPNPDAVRAIEKRWPRWEHEMENIRELGRRAQKEISERWGGGSSDSECESVTPAPTPRPPNARGGSLATRELEAQLLAAGYRIERHERAGRVGGDLKIVAPDGARTFRSKVEAHRHLRGPLPA